MYFLGENKVFQVVVRCWWGFTIFKNGMPRTLALNFTQTS